MTANSGRHPARIAPSTAVRRHRRRGRTRPLLCRKQRFKSGQELLTMDVVDRSQQLFAARAHALTRVGMRAPVAPRSADGAANLIKYSPMRLYIIRGASPAIT